MISKSNLSCGKTGRMSEPILFPLVPQIGQLSSKMGTLQQSHQYTVESIISVLSPQCGHSDNSVVILQLLHVYFIILVSHRLSSKWKCLYQLFRQKPIPIQCYTITLRIKSQSYITANRLNRNKHNGLSFSYEKKNLFIRELRKKSRPPPLLKTKKD